MAPYFGRDPSPCACPSWRGLSDGRWVNPPRKKSKAIRRPEKPTILDIGYMPARLKGTQRQKSLDTKRQR